jgi:3-phenylpropionate/cinnamic acid dioxygenase small subunit
MEQHFKVVQVEGVGDLLVATAANYQVARAAYDTTVSLWPKARIELRQGAHIVLKSGE